jgi:hypothetical protein
MSTLTVSDIPLDRASPSQRLRRIAAAVRVHFTWWGTHKTLTNQQKEEVGIAHSADSRLLTAGKKLIDTRHEAFRNLTSLRSRIIHYWKGVTLPFTEPGIRLLRQSDVEVFVHALQGFREELHEAEQALNTAFEQIKQDARQRLGWLYDARDYPDNIRGLFDVSWDFPTIEPPSYLLRISPENYQQEQERVARQFSQAVELAEQAFIAEFTKLVGHLAQRLQDDGSGERKVFRDTAVTNLLEFFERFRHLSIRSNDDLEKLVEQAQDLVRGVQPQALRSNASMRQQIAEQMGQVQNELESLLVDRPRRRILRMPQEGGSEHDADH